MKTRTHLSTHNIRREARRGFTLIELLTVIAIIGILASILIPVVGRVRDQARTSNCASNLRQIGQAIHLYTIDHDDMTPPSRDPRSSGGSRTIAWTLWEYVGYELRMYGADMSGRTGNLTTVFNCPGTELKPVPTPRSGIFTDRPHSYALNGTPTGTLRGGDFNNAMDYGFPISSLGTPTQTVAVFETSFYYGSGTHYHDQYGLMNHDSGSNFLFWDGHVKRLAYEHVPDSSDLFWVGAPY